MSTEANTVSTLNALFKETYADALSELIPDGVKLLNQINFMAKDKQPGNLFHQPCILGQEHGVTFASSDEDAFTLAPAVAGVIKDAVIKGSPIVMRSLLGYVAASRSVQGGTQAFEDATKYLVANMLRSMAKKLEIELLYGQVGYAEVASVSGAGPFVLTIKTAEWAPGIWAGAEGMPIELTSDGSTVASVCTVTAVNLEDRTVTIVKVSGADPVADDVVFHKGALGKEFAGIHKILTNTGTIFGIDAGAYNIFKGNEFDCESTNLSFTKMNLAAAKGVEKGLDGKLLTMVNPKTWATLMNDQAALRQYDQSYSNVEMKQGSQGIKFFSQNGEIQIEPSIYIKEGYCYMLSIEEWSRVGSSDMTFKRPGQGDQFFRDLENAAAYEMRLYSDQALFCTAPGKNIIVKNIVN